MKNIILFVVLIAALLSFTGCGEKKDISNDSTSTAIENSTAQDITQASEQAVHNYADNTSPGDSEPTSSGKPTFVGNAFQLEEFMKYYGFNQTSVDDNHEIIHEFADGNDGKYYCVFHDGFGRDYITIGYSYIHIYDNDNHGFTSYGTSVEVDKSVEIPTTFEHMVLSQEMYDAVVQLVPTLHERLVSNECPFAGYGIKHGFQPSDHSGSALEMADHGD